VTVRLTRLNPEYWRQIVAVSPLNLCEDTRAVVAVDGDEVVGAVVCDSWTTTACQAHIVIMKKSALKAGLINEVADYVFNQCGRIKIYGTVPADNEAALKLDKHIGFKEVARLEDAYDWDIDYVLMELKKEDCPYWTPRSMVEAA